MVKGEYMLSTNDNPYDYFDQFTSWLLFDKEKGWNCCETLARIADIKDDMSEVEVEEEIERAIDKIIEHDFLNIYKKVTRKSSDNKNQEEKTANIQ